MHGGAEKENSETISRTEKLISTGNQECIAICNKKWLQAGCQVLFWNIVNKFVFAAAVRELLEKGRKKRPKYLPYWTVQLWKKFSFRVLGTNFQLFH